LNDRVAEHAKIIVNHSCQIKKGEFAFISASNEALPLIREIAREIGRLGANYLVSYSDPSVSRAFMLAADEETLGSLPKQVYDLYEKADVFINILGTSNRFAFADIPSAKMKQLSKSFEPILSLFLSKRWNITLHPTDSLAQEAQKSIEWYSDFVYGAILRDWEAMAHEMRVLADRFRKTKNVRITGKDTDLSFSIDGRKPIIDDGRKNLPGGEVFTSPVESTVNGKVYFEYPLVHFGHEATNVSLRFENGEVVESSADRGYETISGILSTDEGAKRLGEFGVGMNRGIKDFSKNMLFDEKMGDTIHLALGRAFEEAGGSNKSAAHVDILKSLKENGGAIFFDDEPVYQNGKFAWE
jgi:aminopeptidase